MWVGPDADASKLAAQDGWSHNAVFPDRHLADEDVRNALERVARARVAAEEKNRRDADGRTANLRGRIRIDIATSGHRRAAGQGRRTGP